MIDAGINKTLGLPDDYQINFKEAMTIIGRFRDATFGSACDISAISFAYYYDKYGDFTKKRNHFDYTVNAMFENLDNKTRFMLLTFWNTPD